jgi:two-component system chemotaxis response regulator CheY
MTSLTRILIVDDEKDITNALKVLLEDRGFDIDTYNDAREALSRYEPGMYALSVIDIRMPDMNGFELFRALKKKDASAKVCFLTAFDVYEREFKRLFPKMKVEGFLRKPISITQMASEIRRITG